MEAEPELLRRALANLSSNALRYGAADSLVTVSTKMEANTLEIMVHNRASPSRQGTCLTCSSVSIAVMPHAINLMTPADWGWQLSNQSCTFIRVRPASKATMRGRCLACTFTVEEFQFR
ncbi:conserved protein of unknown function [Ectopseudomonas oleovorans]|uniref:Uncharacterized protein n=1 Tax=Ectopseudomonas oleovorans TaxID=301 RepID=A0A653AXY6_ECTOL|nr:conserved protein of unknown function [Pseudomonas oleovorans]